jgi:NADH-quinone oxidoreductase subunit I
MLCVRECPDWCISIDAHTEPDNDAPEYSNARRQSTKNVLDKFTINFGDCMWCGICVEVCPFDALFWSSTPIEATSSANNLILDQDQLTKFLPGAKRADGSSAPQVDDPPSGRRKK